MAMNDSNERQKARKFENHKTHGKPKHQAAICACGKRLRNHEIANNGDICDECVDKELSPNLPDPTNLS